MFASTPTVGGPAAASTGAMESHPTVYQEANRPQSPVHRSTYGVAPLPEPVQPQSEPENQVSPLTKAQLLQSINYLLKVSLSIYTQRWISRFNLIIFCPQNDPNFITQLHDAYVQSLKQSLKASQWAETWICPPISFFLHSSVLSLPCSRSLPPLPNSSFALVAGAMGYILFHQMRVPHVCASSLFFMVPYPSTAPATLSPSFILTHSFSSLPSFSHWFVISLNMRPSFFYGQHWPWFDRALGNCDLIRLHVIHQLRVTYCIHNI